MKVIIVVAGFYIQIHLREGKGCVNYKTLIYTILILKKREQKDKCQKYSRFLIRFIK